LTNYCYDIQWNGSLWVAVGSGTNCIATSTDGKTWTGRGTQNFTTVREVCWTGTYWIAVGEPTNGNEAIRYSTDGITWTASTGTTTLLTLGGAAGARNMVKYNQSLTMASLSKITGDADFTPVVLSTAIPEYSAYTFSVPAGNTVASVVNNQIRILGTGSVTITVTQAANELYNSATTTATLTVFSSASAVNTFPAYVSDGILAHFDPAHSSSYSGSGTSMTSLVSGGATATFSGTYSSGTIRLTNTSSTATSNTQYIQLASTNLTGVRTVSFWVKIESIQTLNRYLIDARSTTGESWILYNQSTGLYEVGTLWNGGMLYVNNVPYTLNTTNIDKVFATTGWKHVTLVTASSSFSSDIKLFSRYVLNEALDCSVGPIWVYNKVLSASENTQNYDYFVSTIGNYTSPTNTYPRYPLTANDNSTSTGYIASS
ncbi:MAG: hypothetical protein EBU82_15085, partial [Flavobacteriia bacterium]|nr:hypothetical protein [Flavobacteriia bacterium]